MATDVYRNVLGLYVNRAFRDEVLKSALSYQPRKGDLFVVCYPKCGTTWMQHIVFSIFSDGVAPQNMMEFMMKAPFLELVGAELVEKMPRPGAIKTHLPYDKQPFHSDAKYIYVARNPYDCCVSFYYHTKNLPFYSFENGTFDDFFDMFIEGKVDFGDYFDHLLSWYEHRSDPNVFFITYEDLKRDTRSCVLKLAEFLGEDYGTKLKDHPEILDRILHATSIETMKSLNEKIQTLPQSIESFPEMPESLDYLKNIMRDLQNAPTTGEFIRKGIIGDWRNHFTQEQVRRMKERIAFKTRGSDVMNLWKSSDLP